jgi:hypothetical protein
MVKKVTMGFEDVPVGLTNSVPTPLMIDGSEVKRTMNIRVPMSEVDTLSKRKEIVAISIGFRGVRRSDQMSMSRG